MIINTAFVIQKLYSLLHILVLYIVVRAKQETVLLNCVSKTSGRLPNVTQKTTISNFTQSTTK